MQAEPTASAAVSSTQASTPVSDDDAAPKQTRVRAKKTKEQKAAAKENTEGFWQAIRLAQERVRKDINDLSKEWNR